MITSKSFTKRALLSTCCLISLLLPLISLANNTTDSTQIASAHMKPAEHDVKLANCFTTEEQRYNVTMIDSKSAYPSCPADMVIDKVNLRTEGFFDVDTYVSLVCCKPNITWKQAV